MASLSTYAKLTPPKQFKPEEECVFRLQYSHDLVCNFATLYIWNGNSNSSSIYFGNTGDSVTTDITTGTVSSTGITYEQTQYINTAIGGQWYEEFVIPPNAIARPLTPDDPSYSIPAEKLYAVVYIGNLDDPEAAHVIHSHNEQLFDSHVTKPIFASNTVLVDMIRMWENDLFFAEPGSMRTITEYYTNQSSCTVAIGYIPRHDYGVSGDVDIQSYRFYLYDANYNLIKDSGEQYDWDSNIYYSDGGYTINGLKDNTTYYLKFRVTLNGGYVMYRGYVPIYVHYADDPVASQQLILQNTPEGVKCTLNTPITYTSFIISRSEKYSSNYMEIGQAQGENGFVVDKYAIPLTNYVYRAIVYNGSTVVATYYNNIQYASNSIKISDIYGCFTAIGEITKHPISRNDRGSILETMDSQYPYHIINGSPNYDSGTIDGIFSDLDDDCSVITDSEYLSEKAEVLREWLNNGCAKLLTYYTGESWIVTVNNIQTTDPNNNDMYHTTFNWTQIGDAHKYSDYVRLGLVINNG